MATPVKLIVVDQSLAPVAGVAVQIYTEGLAALQTSGVTDSAGEMVVMLPEADYDLLFYKLGVSIVPKQPQRITVDAGPATNVFQVSSTVKTMPISTDPALCRVSGYFLGADGKPQRGATVTFAPEAEVFVLNEEALGLGSKLTVQGDANGYLEFDLIRTAKYEAFFVAQMSLLDHAPPKFEVIVPDSPSARLDRLLFPVPIDVTFSALTKSLSVSIEWDDSIDTTVTFSDGSVREKGTLFGSVDVQVDNPLVVEAGIIGGKLNLRGLTPGTANVTTVRRIHKAALWLPAAPVFATQTVVVTVI